MDKSLCPSFYHWKVVKTKKNVIEYFMCEHLYSKESPKKFNEGILPLLLFDYQEKIMSAIFIWMGYQKRKNAIRYPGSSDNFFSLVLEWTFLAKH